MFNGNDINKKTLKRVCDDVRNELCLFLFVKTKKQKFCYLDNKHESRICKSIIPTNFSFVSTE